MVAKIIDKLEIANMSFCTSYTLGCAEKVEHLDSGMLAEAEQKRSL